MHNYRACYDLGAVGRVYASVLVDWRFIYIAICFGVGLASYAVCRSKRDWLWLNLGLAATLAADYFLILQNRHIIGVAVFCFAHVAYILRAVRNKPGGARYIFPWLAVLTVVPVWTVLSVLLPGAPQFAATRMITGIFAVTAVYATFFIINIYVSARHLQHNRKLTVAGLLLFAACDICVLLMNLPHYFGAPGWFGNVYPMIWVFYLPSQALLALSAVKWRK